MHPKARLTLYAAISGLLFCLDQYLKSIARAHPSATYYVLRPYLGWQYFANSGVAFSLPLPHMVALIFTPIILTALFILLFRYKNQPKFFFGLTLILAGALSNYLDRLFFGVTIDYLRIFTGIINLADLMITSGVIFILFASPKKEPKAS